MATVEQDRNERPERRMLTVREVAAELGVSEKSVRRWVRDGALPVWRRGSILRISRESLDEFLERA